VSPSSESEPKPEPLAIPDYDPPIPEFTRDYLLEIDAAVQAALNAVPADWQGDPRLYIAKMMLARVPGGTASHMLNLYVRMIDASRSDG
jgi:hypothetical protein